MQNFTLEEFNLLQQKVNLIESHMDWTIGGISITITVLMAIFAIIQFVYQRKIENERLKEIENNLKELISKEFSKKEEDLKKIIEDRINKTEITLENKSFSLGADIARQFAFSCEKIPAPSLAFSWWISAASKYSEIGSDELCSISITSAKDALEKVNSKSDIDSLLKSTSNISDSIELLKKNHNTEASLLEDLFKNKLRSKPSTTPLDASF